MIESAARRDRVDSSAASPTFLWEVPQKPVNVSLTFDLIDRMEQEVLEGFRSLTSRGSEIGGLLLGRSLPGTPARVMVEEFEAVECDYSRGPLYRLSDADLGRLERSIEQRARGGGLDVVGFFRSHTRKGLTLDAEDLAFLDAHLRKPFQIALLVRPFATKASVAGIFIREDGAIRGDSSYLEFPFRTSQLAITKKEAAPAPRAQIVPIASRREISLVPAAPIEEPPVPKFADPEPLPVMAASRPAPPEPPPAPVATAPPLPEPAPAPAVTETAEIAVETAPPGFAVVDPETKPNKRRLVLIAGVVLAIAVAGGVFSMFGRHGGSRIPATSADTDSLNLRAERSGADLLLTWNRDAAPIQNASRAMLAIYDGGRQESYEMDLGQLRTGSIVYAPLTADVSFRLDVTRRDQRTITATVRMLRTRPSPMPNDSPAATGEKTTAAPAQAADAKDTTPADASETESARPSMAVSPVKPFDASSLAARLHPVRAADQPDIPNLSGGAPVTPKVNTDVAVPFGSMPAAAPPPPAARTAQAAAPARTADEAVVGGRIQQAELLIRREPEYPPMARQMGTKGAVELVATIGTDGHVKAVKVLHGPPVLGRAATEAVMQWVYRPTLLNGVPVPNETRITLNFLGR